MQTLGSWQSPRGPSLLVKFANIDEQLRYLRTVVDKWRGAPLIRNLSLDIVQETGVASRDKRAQSIALAGYVQNTIYYVHELPERFQTPEETLNRRAGDCDDTTVLVAAMLESLGIPSALVACKWDDEWRHIFPAAWLPSGTLLPLDTTMASPVSDCLNPAEWARERGRQVTIKIA